MVMLDGEPYLIRAGEQIDDYSDRMEGIRISEDWLTKFGFIKVDESGGYTLWNHENFTAYFKFTLFEANGLRLRIVFTAGREYYSPNLNATFQYVHELQNLYYYTTRQEIADYKTLEERLKNWK